MHADDESRRARFMRNVPFALGGVALLVGLVLGLWPRAEEKPSVIASQGGSSEGGAAPYEPELGGPDVGKVVLADVEVSSGLGVAAGRLVWLATERAALYSASLDEPAPAKRFEAEEGAFGGALATTASRVCWTVLGKEPAEVLCLAAARLGSAVPPEQVAAGGSPDHLSLDGDVLYWADRGRVLRASPGAAEPVVLASSGQRIAALATAKEQAIWLELPYAEGARGRHRLMSSKEGKTNTLATLSTPRDRRHLWLDGEHIGWAEADDGWELKEQDGTTLARTGEVTSATVAGGELYWAEAHDFDGGVVTLLRSVPLAGGRSERLGRVSGPVGALAAHQGALYWSEARGIVAHRPASD